MLAQSTLPVSKPMALHVMQRLGLEETWRQTEWYDWLILLGFIFCGVLAGRVVGNVFRSLADRFQRRGNRGVATTLISAATPANLLCTAVGLSMGLGAIHIEPAPLVIEHKVMTLLYVIAIGWFLFNLIELIDLWLESLAEHTRSHLDDQLAPLIRKTLRIFVVVLVGLYIAQNVFDQNITTWLAGLGIAGLAVSLAAQDSIKNLFGSITILLDKPFSVGDRIVFDPFDGRVEEIGFRSTKLRMLTGEVATIPNAKFIDGLVKNVSRRPSIPKTIEFTLPADTAPDKVRRIIERLRAVANDPALQSQYVDAPQVYFDEIRGGAPVVHLTYGFATEDTTRFSEHLQELHLRLVAALKEELART
jgi:MscS family membrane protein